MTASYVHGYGAQEVRRLQDQAATLEELLHGDTHYPAGARVLEAGCGVGAQTAALAARSPDAEIIAIDRSEDSLREARSRVTHPNVSFRQADILDLPFAASAFDHVFLCFVLEHVAQPIELLAALRRVLKPGGTLTVIEGDHGSALFSPDSAAARAAIDCQVSLQARDGGDALIGRRLYPLLHQAGLHDIQVSPRLVYADGSRPELADGFTRRTFTAMIAGVRDAALREGLATAAGFDQGIADLLRAAEADGVFCYTFFKAVCVA